MDAWNGLPFLPELPTLSKTTYVLEKRLIVVRDEVAKQTRRATGCARPHEGGAGRAAKGLSSSRRVYLL